MTSTLFVEELKGRTSGTNANKVIVPSGQTLQVPTVTGNPSFTGGLKVNTVQNTAGTTAMTIDSSGRILTPARPAFHVGTSLTQDISDSGNGGPTTTIRFNTEFFDIGNNFDHSGTYKFTAPIAGIYFFNITALQAGNGAQMTLSIRKNASATGRFIARTDGDGGEHHGCSVSAMFNLAVNDTVEGYLEGGRIYGDTNFSNFIGYLVG